MKRKLFANWTKYDDVLYVLDGEIKFLEREVNYQSMIVSTVRSESVKELHSRELEIAKAKLQEARCIRNIFQDQHLKKLGKI